MFNFFVIGSCF